MRAKFQEGDWVWTLACTYIAKYKGCLPPREGQSLISASTDTFEVLHGSLPAFRAKLVAYLDRRISKGAKVVSVINDQIVVHKRGRLLAAQRARQPRFDFA